MSRDMPAGYDPKLDDLEIPSDPETESIFNGPPALDESVGGGSSEVDAQLFGNSDGYDPTEGSKDSGRSLFEAAMKAEEQKKKKGGGIPAYARELAESMGYKLQEEDEDEEEPDDEVGVDEDDDDVDIDVGGGTFDDLPDADFGDDDDIDLDDPDLDEDEMDEEFDIDDEDIEQADRWRDEQDVDEEMSRLLGGDSPYVQGATAGGGSGGHKRGSHSFDRGLSPTYRGVSDSSPYVDEDLIHAEKFSSGGFIEHFEDGFVFVGSNGASLALVKPEEEDDEVLDFDATDDSLRGFLLFRPEGAEDDDDEITMGLSGEELDSLSQALQGFRAAGQTLGATSFVEHARQRAKKAKAIKESKKKRRKR